LGHSGGAGTHYFGQGSCLKGYARVSIKDKRPFVYCIQKEVNGLNYFTGYDIFSQGFPKKKGGFSFREAEEAP